MLKVRVLGPVEAQSEGRPVALGGPRPRLVLAMLALDHGQVVNRDRLVDAIWESGPPESAVNQVTIHISRLRKALGSADAIETVGTGYRLSTDGIEVDAVVAEHLLREARAIQKPELFRDALAMWRGPVLNGVDSTTITPAARRLDDLYLTGVEDWSAVELDSGGERAVLEVLPDVVARHPLRESVRARLMEALWHGGRRADALAVFDEGRQALADELGIDPGEELARLHHQILQEPDPTVPTAPAGNAGSLVGSRTSGADVPRQLPMDVPHFAGRTADVDAMRSLLNEENGHGLVVGLHGPGGVGKTTLAVHVAHRMADRYVDGQLFLNLHGFGTGDPLDAGIALGSILRTLGVPESQIPTDEDDRSALMRSVLAGRRMLMVLDNARDSFQVRPLLPGGDVAVLVTSRSQLRSLATREGAQRVHVEEMTSAEAAALLRARQSAQTRRSGSWAESDVAELARLCGRLPVALAVAAERANRYPDRPLSELNAELRGGHAALDTLTAWEDDPATSVRAVLSWSYDALDADAARMFGLIGLHPHPTLDVHAAAALAGLDLCEAPRMLDRLVDSHLMTERRPGEYELHDLVHAFATHLADAQVGETGHSQAVARMRAMYAHSMNHAIAISWGAPPPHPLPPLPHIVTSAAFEDLHQSARWFIDHERRLRAVLDDAIAAADHADAMLLALHMASLCREHGRMHDGTQMNQVALEHAVLSGDAKAMAQCSLLLGRALFYSDPEASLPHLTAAYEGFVRLDNVASATRVLMAQGMALSALGRHDEAIAMSGAAAERVRRHDLPLTDVFVNHACVLLEAEHLHDAITSAEEAVRVARRHGVSRDEAMAFDAIGVANLGLGEPQAALAASDKALACDDLGLGIEQAHLLRTRGLALRDLGRRSDARDAWRRALALMDDLDAADTHELGRTELRALLTELDDGSASPQESTQH